MKLKREREREREKKEDGGRKRGRGGERKGEIDFRARLWTDTKGVTS